PTPQRRSLETDQYRKQKNNSRLRPWRHGQYARQNRDCDDHHDPQQADQEEPMPQHPERSQDACAPGETIAYKGKTLGMVVAGVPARGWFEYRINSHAGSVNV